jgi:purine-nucleoside phosphorylase
LGTAFDSIADQLTDAITVRYETIPHFPRTNSSSRAGRLVIRKFVEVPLGGLCGRVHYYEGQGLDAVVFPIRMLARIGICSMVITSAAGSINPAFTPGSLAVLCDHINLLGSNPMIGSVDERLGSRFADMSEVYNRRYREVARSSADNLGFSLLEGVFAGHTGPSYETPAEVRSLRNQGADVVGMSVVPEVIAARHLGIRILAICAITNVAAGVETKTISHSEMLSLAQALPKRLSALLERVIPLIAAEL